MEMLELCMRGEPLFFFGKFADAEIENITMILIQELAERPEKIDVSMITRKIENEVGVCLREIKITRVIAL